MTSAYQLLHTVDAFNKAFPGLQVCVAYRDAERYSDIMTLQGCRDVMMSQGYRDLVERFPAWLKEACHDKECIKVAEFCRHDCILRDVLTSTQNIHRYTRVEFDKQETKFRYFTRYVTKAIIIPEISPRRVFLDIVVENTASPEVNTVASRTRLLLQAICRGPEDSKGARVGSFTRSRVYRSLGRDSLFVDGYLSVGHLNVDIDQIHIEFEENGKPVASGPAEAHAEKFIGKKRNEEILKKVLDTDLHAPARLFSLFGKGSELIGILAADKYLAEPKERGVESEDEQVNDENWLKLFADEIARNLAESSDSPFLAARRRLRAAEATDYQSLLKVIRDSLADIDEIHAAHIRAVHPYHGQPKELGTIKVKGEYGERATPNKPFCATSLVSEVAQSGFPRVINNWRTYRDAESYKRGCTDYEKSILSDLEAIAVFPIKVGSKTIGVFAFHSNTPDAFSVEGAQAYCVELCNFATQMLLTDRANHAWMEAVHRVCHSIGSIGAGLGLHLETIRNSCSIGISDERLQFHAENALRHHRIVQEQIRRLQERSAKGGPTAMLGRPAWLGEAVWSIAMQASLIEGSKVSVQLDCPDSTDMKRLRIPMGADVLAGHIALLLKDSLDFCRHGVDISRRISFNVSTSEFGCFLLTITYSDNGTGVRDKLKDDIFRFGFTTRPEKSTGIGLADLWLDLQAAGGSVSEKGVFGQGAKFIIMMPLIG